MTKSAVLRATERAFERWQEWHDPFRVPEREVMEDIVTEDFQLIYATKDLKTVCNSIDDYLEVAAGLVNMGCNVRIEPKILGVGDNHCFVRDVHTWTIGGRSFTSERIDVAEERDGKICRIRVLPFDPYAFDDWFATLPADLK